MILSKSRPWHAEGGKDPETEGGKTRKFNLVCWQLATRSDRRSADKPMCARGAMPGRAPSGLRKVTAELRFWH